MKKLIYILSLVVLSAIATAAPAQADVAFAITAKSTASNFVGNQPGVSARQAAAAARDKVGGRVISVKPKKGGEGFRVRMLVEGGRVITVNVDEKGNVRGS